MNHILYHRTVLIHEFAHVVTARRHGLVVKGLRVPSVIRLEPTQAEPFLLVMGVVLTEVANLNEEIDDAWRPRTEIADQILEVAVAGVVAEMLHAKLPISARSLEEMLCHFTNEGDLQWIQRLLGPNIDWDTVSTVADRAIQTLQAWMPDIIARASKYDQDRLASGIHSGLVVFSAQDLAEMFGAASLQTQTLR